MLNFFIDMFQRVSYFTLDRLLPSILILVVGIILIQAVLSIVSKVLARSNMERAAHSLITSVVKFALYLVLGLTIAPKLGIDVTGIVALASVLTLAVSLSVQNMLTNVISGFTLLTTKPFRSGDFVEIAGQAGTVTEIGITYTKLQTPDNKLVSIPNSAVTGAQIVNYTATGTRRVEFTFTASYDSPVDDVLAALQEAAKVPTALDTPAPFSAVKNYGESSIEYVLHVWSGCDDYWTTLFTVNKRVKEVFTEKGIAMTYPHLNVHIEK